MAEAPVGRYVAGDTYAHFCAAPTLWGFILWGRPSRQHAMELYRSLVLELAPPAVPHASVIDASRLEGHDPSAFRAAEQYLAHYGAALHTWVVRQALVRPGGLGGAVVAGAFEVLPRPYPVGVFEDAGEAFTWMAPAAGDGWPADGAALLAAIHAEAAATPPLLGALRGWLDHNLQAELPAAARAVAASERTLQRKLGDAGTSFKEELAEARVRAARRLLIETDTPLTAIAFEVGCASLQHFSALFRKRAGESPSAFRARHRPPR